MSPQVVVAEPRARRWFHQVDGRAWTPRRAPRNLSRMNERHRTTLDATPIASVPADFPRSAPLAAVAGAQPKTLARQDGSAFVSPGEDETQARYVVCADLVNQLLAYAAKKRSERPDWSNLEVQAKVVASTRQKSFAWGLSPAETEWVVSQFCLLSESQA